MGQDEETTYRYVESSGRTKVKRRGAATPASVDAPQGSGRESLPEALAETRSDAELRFEREVQAAFEARDFAQVCDRLGPPEAAEARPPHLALLYVLARTARDDTEALTDLPALALVAAGKLMNVPEDSRAARALAKRVMGLQSPSSPAPSRRHATFIALALVLGIALGWVAGAYLLAS